MFTRAAALEFASRSIRVNAVDPGPASTAIGDEIDAPDLPNRRRFQKPNPVGRRARPDEIAGLSLSTDDESFDLEAVQVDSGGIDPSANALKAPLLTRVNGPAL